MKITMDSSGRLVIPKDIRREAGLKPGAPLEVRVNDGRVEIEPKAIPVRLERRGHLVVAVPLVPVPPLSDDVVERTKQQIRRERGR